MISALAAPYSRGMTLAPTSDAGATGPFSSADDACVRVEGLRIGRVGPVSFDLHPGEATVILGDPACDAHDLVSAIGGARRPDAGRSMIDGVDLAQLTGAAGARTRFGLVGYVMRDIGLRPGDTVAENIASPLALAGRVASVFGSSARPDAVGTESREQSDARWLARLAQSFGLARCLDAPAGSLDPGMQQRVAIARALATRPKLVAAEEPIAQLSERDGRVVLALLRTIAHEYGIALAISTGDAALAAPSDRVISLRDGRVVDDRRGPRAH